MAKDFYRAGSTINSIGYMEGRLRELKLIKAGAERAKEKRVPYGKGTISYTTINAMIRTWEEAIERKKEEEKAMQVTTGD